MSAHSTVISPWSGQCSSHPFCTRGMRTSIDFWARVVATYKVPHNPDLCGVLSGKTDRTKRRNQSVSGDDAGLIYPNIVLGLWPVIFGKWRVIRARRTAPIVGDFGIGLR